MVLRSILILFLIFISGLTADNLTYITEQNVPYYSTELGQADDYIKERCVADLYYPENNFGVRIEDTLYLNNNGQFEVLAEYPYDLVIPIKT